MEEKDLDKMLEEFNGRMEKLIDDMGMRDDYEKFKEEHKEKSEE